MYLIFYFLSLNFFSFLCHSLKAILLFLLFFFPVGVRLPCCFCFLLFLIVYLLFLFGLCNLGLGSNGELAFDGQDNFLFGPSSNKKKLIFYFFHLHIWFFSLQYMYFVHTKKIIKLASINLLK